MNILITGGTGLLGTALTQLLLSKGHTVSLLSRQKQYIPNVQVYEWNLSSNYIEAGALENADVIVHLAGAGIADKRWTEARKKEIIDSRVKPLQLIEQQLIEKNMPPKALISASAIGFYGGDTGNSELSEESAAGNDFLATCTVLWEKAADSLGKSLGFRVVKVRIGVVLSTDGGALPKLISPIKWGAGAALGSGTQWMSWIHIHDLARFFVKAIEDTTLSGQYNAVAPKPVTNSQLTKEAAKVLKKPLLLPNVPAFLLKLALGEMAVVVTGGNYVRNKKIEETTDFIYDFPTIESCLSDLLC